MNSTSIKSVYLAGPITGLTYDGCTDWRDHASKELAAQGITCYSPMRAKEYLRSEGRLIGSYEDHPTATAKGITARDRFDVQTCDLVLMNLLGAERVSIGTMIEVGWADAWRKPIVLAIEKPKWFVFLRKKNIHDHPMLSEIASFVVHSLAEAIDTTRAILLAK